MIRIKTPLIYQNGRGAWERTGIAGLSWGCRSPERQHSRSGDRHSQAHAILRFHSKSQRLAWQFAGIVNAYKIGDIGAALRRNYEPDYNKMIRGIAKYVYETLLPERMKTNLDIFRYLRMERIDGITEKNVLILAPHPDDETVGCGGTIRAYRQVGAHITCVYMTDGRRGNPDYDENTLVEIRRSEARKVAEILGIDRTVFLENHDEELAVTAETVGQLTRILEDVRPEAVFLPFFTDNHPDHKATSRIFLAAVKQMKTNPMCHTWGLWTPLPYFNVTVDITPYIDSKKEALEAYRSETERFDLVGAALGFAKYYYVISGGKGKTGWTEVFLAFPAREFIRLGEMLEWRHR